MHGMAVEVRAGPSKGAGVSVGEVWTREAEMSEASRMAM
jgi:hypothetical protein